MKRFLFGLVCALCLAGTSALLILPKVRHGITKVEATNPEQKLPTTASAWRTVSSSLEQPFTQIQFLDRLNGWGISANALWHTLDGGTNWTKVIDSSTTTLLGHAHRNIFYRVQFLNENDAWLLEENSLLHTTDAGRSWSKRKFDTSVIRAFHFLDTECGWAVGAASVPRGEKDEVESWQGIVFGTKDGGNTWQEVPLHIRLDYNWSLFDVWPIDRNRIWIVGDLVLKSRDGGKTWQQSEIDQRLYGVPSNIGFNGDHLGWIITNQGNRFLITKDGGKSWKVGEGPPDVGGFYSMVFASPTAVWAAINDVFYSPDGGKSWSKETEGHFSHLYSVRNAGVIFAAGSAVSVREQSSP